MEPKKSIHLTIRMLHRNVGFFIFGFIVIYALSGITLIFRDSNFLKVEKKIQTRLPIETKPSAIGPALKLREFRILETRGDTILFQGGSFNKATGDAEYTIKELIFPLNKLTTLHKTPSKNPLHWLSLVLGILLLFMAISSLWMFSPKTKKFKQGAIVAATGILIACLLLLLV